MSDSTVTFTGIKKIYDRNGIDPHYYHDPATKPTDRAQKIRFINNKAGSHDQHLAASVKIWDYNFPHELDDIIRNVWGSTELWDFVIEERLANFRTEQHDKGRFVVIGAAGRSGGWIEISNVSVIFEPDKENEAAYEAEYALFDAWGQRFNTGWDVIQKKAGEAMVAMANEQIGQFTAIIANADISHAGRIKLLTDAASGLNFKLDDVKSRYEREYRQAMHKSDPMPSVDPLNTWTDEAIDNFFGLLWDFHEWLHDTYIATIEYAIEKAELPF